MGEKDGCKAKDTGQEIDYLISFATWLRDQPEAVLRYDCSIPGFQVKGWAFIL